MRPTPPTKPPPAAPRNHLPDDQSEAAQKFITDLEAWVPGTEPAPILLRFEGCTEESLLQISDKDGGAVAVEILQQCVEEVFFAYPLGGIFDKPVWKSSKGLYFFCCPSSKDGGWYLSHELFLDIDSVGAKELHIL